MELICEALKFINEASLDEKDKEEVFFSYLNTIPESSIPEFLNLLGVYKSISLFSTIFLDKVYERVGELELNSILFGTMLFDYDVEIMDFSLISNKLNHPLFSKIKEELKVNILKMIVNSKNIPNQINSSQIKPILIGNHQNLPSLTKGQFLNIANRSLNNIRKDFQLSDGAKLANKIKTQIETLKNKYEKFLYVLDLTKDDIYLIRKLTLYYLTNAIRSQDLEDFVKIWTEGGLLFISGVLCARDLDKTDNRSFWREYYRWLNLDNDTIKVKSSQSVAKSVLEFWKSNKILFSITKNGDKQYVMTFLMHSIVSNRPLSKNLTVKFLKKMVKGSGTIYHDKDEQKELLYQDLQAYSKPIIEASDEMGATQQYLQIPRETALAFSFVEKQVINYLIPIYDYMEKILVDIINDSHSFNITTSKIPLFIEEAIQETITNTSKDELLRAQKLVNLNKLGKPTLFLNHDDLKLYYKIPSHILLDLDPKFPTHIHLADENNKELYHDEIGVKNDKDFSITEEVTIECEDPSLDAFYKIVHRGEPLGRYDIKASIFFDYQGNPVDFPISEPLHTFAITKEEIVGDNIAISKKNFIRDLSLWHVYLDENSLAIVDNKIYGVKSNEFPNNNGWVKQSSTYRQVKVSIDKKEYPLIGNYPIFFIRREANKPLNTVSMSLNGNEIPYKLLTTTILADSSGEILYRLVADNTVPILNGEFVSIRIFDNLYKRELIQVKAFVLEDLSFSFSKDIYCKEEEVTTTLLSFKNSENLFGGHYNFPLSQFSFKLNYKSSDNCKLLLPAPLVKITSGGKELIGKKFWYKDLASGENIVIEYPTNIIYTQMFTINKTNNIVHALKKRGKKYKTFHLHRDISSDDKYARLILRIHTSIENYWDFKVCEIYYKVERLKSERDFFYVKPSDNINYKIDTGLTINFKFLAKKDSTYLVRLFDPQKKLVFEKKLLQDNTLSYNREKNLNRGVYLLKVIEVTHNRFTNKHEGREVYVEELVYPPPENKRIKITKSFNENIEKSKSQKVISTYNDDKKELIIDSIKFTHTAKRVAASKDESPFAKEMRIKPFHVKSKPGLVDRTPFGTEVFYLDESGEKQKVEAINPIKIEVLKIEGIKVVASLVDNKSSPLVVGEKSKHINPLDHSNCERKISKKLFYGELIKQIGVRDVI